MKIKSIATVAMIMVAAFFSFGFILKPKANPREVEVITKVEMIEGHQYVIAVSSTIFGYDAKSSIAMVHHEGCTTCARNKGAPKVSHRRPPVPPFYPGQI